MLGQAKMVVSVSRRRTVEGREILSPLNVCVELIRTRIQLDFGFYRIAGDLDSFRDMWCYRDVLCQVKDNELLFEDVLV